VIWRLRDVLKGLVYKYSIKPQKAKIFDSQFKFNNNANVYTMTNNSISLDYIDKNDQKDLLAYN